MMWVQAAWVAQGGSACIFSAEQTHFQMSVMCGDSPPADFCGNLKFTLAESQVPRKLQESNQPAASPYRLSYNGRVKMTIHGEFCMKIDRQGCVSARDLF